MVEGDGLICVGDGGLFSGIAINFISQVIRFNSQAGQEQTCRVKKQENLHQQTIR
jgi:hypothetical protein